MLNVDENINASFQQFFDILPAFGMPEPGALLCASSSIKISAGGGRGRHEIKSRWRAHGAWRFNGRTASLPARRRSSPVGFYHANHNIQPLRSQSLAHRQVIADARTGTEENFQLSRCGAAVCSSRRSGSGTGGSLFIMFIQRQIEFNNVDNRLADIFHQRLLAVACDQLRELFNAEITRLPRVGFARPSLAGVILLSSLLADAVTVQLERSRWHLVSGLYAATRAAISLSSSGLLTARLLLARSLWIIGHFAVADGRP